MGPCHPSGHHAARTRATLAAILKSQLMSRPNRSGRREEPPCRLPLLIASARLRFLATVERRDDTTMPSPTRLDYESDRFIRLCGPLPSGNPLKAPQFPENPSNAR